MGGKGDFTVSCRPGRAAKFIKKLGRKSVCNSQPNTRFGSDILEMDIEIARGKSLKVAVILELTADNDSDFAVKILAEILSAHGRKHIFGTPNSFQEKGRPGG
jgi:hypothetical protein